jgi:hypothetical protein
MTRARGVPRTYPKIPRTYNFTVAGTGQFPIDMLRFDMCRPASESDSNEIERSYQPRNRVEHRVRLVGPKAPTEPRWGSFGWAVEGVI